MEKIDFVVTWVDGNDANWRLERKKYEALEYGQAGAIMPKQTPKEDANDDCRFRDFGLIKYWFRSVEAYAPWVNRIHFVTCGQVPGWLNTDHPKLHLVNHTDFIPSKYLPTFNSNPIELNLHRIEGLTEQFVIFNDDTILLRPIDSSFFFRNGNPVLACNLRYPSIPHANTINRIKLNNYSVINNHFDTRESIWKNRSKWFNLSALGFKYSRINFICFLANKTIPVGTYGHVAFPHLKSTFEKAWRVEYDILDESSRCRFRSDCQVNQWMLCAWNQAEGKFYPALEAKVGRLFDISPQSIPWIVDSIRDKTYPQLCINDSRFNIEPEKSSGIILQELNKVFTHKSQYEK